MVDGRPVSPGNEAARKLAAALLRLDPRIRPTELGSPWALGDPVAFTDGDHQNHIHVAFDDPMRPGQSLPPAAGGPASSVPVEAPDDADDPDQPEDTADVDDQDDGDGDADADDDDGDDDGDEEDDEDDDADEEQGGDGDDDDDDEDEDEPDEDEVGPDMEDLTDDEVVAGGAAPGEPEESALPDDPAAAGPELDLGDVASGYPGDGAPQEHVAAWMAAEAQRRGLPPELPVMASLVESR